jgi:putative ABC transport system permease protein
MTTVSIFTAIASSILQGLLYGIATVGFSIGYRYMKFPDFTTLAAIMVGGVTCVVVTNQTEFWVFGLFSGLVVGGLLGLCTGLQISLFKIPPTLAGITTSVGAITLAYLITSNNADAVVLKLGSYGFLLDFIAGNIFSFEGLAGGIIEIIIVAFVVSRIFSTRYGDYILALQGTKNYIDHRHHSVDATVYGLLVLSNSIIGLAGALLAFQNGGQASVDNHKDFLLLALAGYSLGAKLIVEVNKLSKENSLREGGKVFWTKGLLLFIPLYRWFVDKVTRNDEEPIKICLSLLTYGFATVSINSIFRVIDIELSDKNYGYFFKASLLFLILWVTSNSRQISGQKSEE